MGYTKKSNTIGSSDSDSSSGSKWTNSHDKYYTTYEKVNALLREREKLERRYDKLLQKRGLSGKELVKNAKE